MVTKDQESKFGGGMVIISTLQVLSLSLIAFFWTKLTQV